MVSPGTLQLLTALSKEHEKFTPTIEPESGTVGYPAAEEYLDGSDDSAFEVLESLSDRDIVEKKFQEKVYVCPDCRTKGLRYTTVCPHCESPYTLETELFEHVVCDTVEPADRFETSEGHRCPGCDESLDSRDRIETGWGHVCQDCGEWAETPANRLQCPTCRARYEPLDAIERALCRYSLHEEGTRWLDTHLAARSAIVELLDDRGFETRVNATIPGRDQRVHVYAEEVLLDSRIVVAIHERPDEGDVAALREAATDADARAIVISTTGSVGPQAAELVRDDGINLLSVDADGHLERDYEVTENPSGRRTIVERLTSAVTQSR